MDSSSIAYKEAKQSELAELSEKFASIPFVIVLITEQPWSIYAEDTWRILSGKVTVHDKEAEALDYIKINVVEEKVVKVDRRAEADRFFN